MIVETFLLLVSGGADPVAAAQQSPRPVRMSIALAAGASVRWIGLRVELCGMIEKTPTGRFILVERSGADAGVYVDERIASRRIENGIACYEGIWRRVDGKSFEEAVTGPQTVITHGYNPEYELSGK